MSLSKFAASSFGTLSHTVRWSPKMDGLLFGTHWKMLNDGTLVRISFIDRDFEKIRHSWKWKLKYWIRAFLILLVLYMLCFYKLPKNPNILTNKRKYAPKFLHWASFDRCQRWIKAVISTPTPWLTLFWFLENSC